MDAQNGFSSWIERANGQKHALIRWFFSAYDAVLDLIFPKESLTRELEAMGTADFLEKSGGLLSRGADQRRRQKQWQQQEHGQYQTIPLSTISLFAYRNRYVRAAIWNVKYKKNRAVARLMAHFAADAMADLIDKEKMARTMIVPMPISDARRKERGYNQIEFLLEHVPPNMRAHVRDDILKKTMDTPAQTSFKSRADRLHNLSDCFAVAEAKKAQISESCIILVDDVLTTGTTARKARAALLSAGAKEVRVLTLAH